MISNDEYKRKIKSEYDRLFGDKKNEPFYIHIVMYGDEGLEGYMVTQNIEELDKVNSMILRARFNSHRNIKVYGFTSSSPIDPDDINMELLSNKKVKVLF